MLRAPFGEFVEAPSDVPTITAHIPRRRISGGGRTRRVIHGQVTQTNRHVERVFVKTGRSIHQIDDPLLGCILWGRVGLEIVGHFTISGHTDQRDLLGLGASRSIPNC